MSIPLRLSSYLEQCQVHYEVCTHPLSHTSAQTARTAKVPPHAVAKAVVLEDDGGCIVAVVPADRKVKLGEVSRMLGRKHLRLADESGVASVFVGCDRGAVPALGMAWGVETVVDDELDAGQVVYVEAGDHQCLLRLSHDEFHALMRDARHGHFCSEPTH